MNTRALHTYGRTARAGLSGRALEAALLSQIAIDLERSVTRDPVDLDGLNDAVARQRKLWALIGGDASAPATHLPAPLRSEIQGLCAWTLRQSLRAMVDPRPEQVLPLARVNRILAEGLGSAPDAPVPPSSAIGERSI